MQQNAPKNYILRQDDVKDVESCTTATQSVANNLGNENGKINAFDNDATKHVISDCRASA